MRRSAMASRPVSVAISSTSISVAAIDCNVP